MWGAVFGISLALGPVLGGLLVTDCRAGGRSSGSTSRSAIAAIVLTQLFVPESKARHARRFDPWGQLLVIVCARGR